MPESFLPGKNEIAEAAKRIKELRQSRMSLRSFTLAPAFTPRTFAYLKKEALVGKLVRVYLKSVLPTHGDNVIYVDLLNSLWMESELLTKEQAELVVQGSPYVDGTVLDPCTPPAPLRRRPMSHFVGTDAYVADDARSGNITKVSIRRLTDEGDCEDETGMRWRQGQIVGEADALDMATKHWLKRKLALERAFKDRSV